MSRPETEPILPPGYVQDRVLGRRGGVWVLQAHKGGERVALRLGSGGAAAEGLAELAVLAAVDHPGVAPLIDYGPLTGGGRYLARRWIEGQDLLAWGHGKPGEEIGGMVARLCPA